MDLSTDSLVYQYNSSDKFIPASNTKLFTTAAALEKLGPEYTYRTELYACGPLDSAGVLHGDLLVRGSGDPTIGDVRTLMEWADSLKALGVTAVAGDVIGDEGNFTPERLVSMVPRSSNGWSSARSGWPGSCRPVVPRQHGAGDGLRRRAGQAAAGDHRSADGHQGQEPQQDAEGRVLHQGQDLQAAQRRSYTRNVKLYRGGTPSSPSRRGAQGHRHHRQGGSKRFIFMAKEPESHFARILTAVLRTRDIAVAGEPASLRNAICGPTARRCCTPTTRRRSPRSSR